LDSARKFKLTQLQQRRLLSKALPYILLQFSPEGDVDISDDDNTWPGYSDPKLFNAANTLPEKKVWICNMSALFPISLNTQFSNDPLLGRRKWCSLHQNKAPTTITLLQIPKADQLVHERRFGTRHQQKVRRQRHLETEGYKQQMQVNLPIQ
jgi:hypothetical protein